MMGDIVKCPNLITSLVYLPPRALILFAFAVEL